jgi:hypothetical protein
LQKLENIGTTSRLASSEPVTLKISGAQPDKPGMGVRFDVQKKPMSDDIMAIFWCCQQFYNNNGTQE